MPVLLYFSKQVVLNSNLKINSSPKKNLLNYLEAEESVFCKNLLKHSCDGPANIPWSEEQLIKNNMFAEKILEVRERVNILFSKFLLNEMSFFEQLTGLLQQRSLKCLQRANSQVT